MQAHRGGALGLAAVLSATACEAVVRHDPSSDGGASYISPPADGGAPGSGGAPTIGGAPNSGGAPGIGGAPTAGGGCAGSPVPSGEPLMIASGLDQPGGIVLVGDDLYVTEATGGAPDGSLARVPKLGGELERVSTNHTQPWAIAASDDYVYWANYGDGTNGSLNRLALADDSVDVLAAELYFPWALASHGGSLYSIESNGNRVLALRPNLSLEVLAYTPTGFPIAADETGVYFGGGSIPPVEAVVRRIDNDGNLSVVYAETDTANTIVLHGNDLYYSGTNGFIRRGTRDGAPAVTLAQVEGGVFSGVVDDCFLYFTAPLSSGLGRVRLEGGEVQWLGVDLATFIAVDEEAIYWSSADGSVYRLAK